MAVFAGEGGPREQPARGAPPRALPWRRREALAAPHHRRGARLENQMNKVVQGIAACAALSLVALTSTSAFAGGEGEANHFFLGVNGVALGVITPEKAKFA